MSSINQKKFVRQYWRSFWRAGAVVFTAGILLFGCEQPRIFAPQDDGTTNYRGGRNLSDQEVLISLQITGGFAGVNQRLTIFTDGLAFFEDYRPANVRFLNYLTLAEFSQLQALFQDNDFVHLDARYLDANAMDVLYYNITYRQNEASHQVATDYLSAPAGLREIIDSLNKIIQKLQFETLRLTLVTSADSLRHDELLTLKFSVTNVSGAPLTLYFADAQVFDFFAFKSTEDISQWISLGAGAATEFWNWAHDKVFSAVLQTQTIYANETREYEIQWDGRDNTGAPLHGEYWVGAALLSTPGGSTPLVQVFVAE